MCSRQLSSGECVVWYVCARKVCSSHVSHGRETPHFQPNSLLSSRLSIISMTLVYDRFVLGGSVGVFCFSYCTVIFLLLLLFLPLSSLFQSAYICLVQTQPAYPLR